MAIFFYEYYYLSNFCTFVAKDKWNFRMKEKETIFDTLQFHVKICM